MNVVENVARRLCAADGFNPDQQEQYAIVSHIGTHKRESIMCQAPPRWEAYVCKAKRILEDEPR